MKYWEARYEAKYGEMQRLQEAQAFQRAKAIIDRGRAKVILYTCSMCDGLTLRWFGTGKLCAMCWDRVQKFDSPAQTVERIVYVVDPDGTETEMRISATGGVVVRTTKPHPVVSTARKIRS